MPPARDDELPELVTNQALRESTAFSDKASMDFLALDDDPTQPRQVIVAVLGEAQLERIRATCAASGIKPRRMLLRPYASASLFSRTASPREDVCLLVNRVADEVDLTVLVRGKVVFSRTARLPAEVDKDTATERLVGRDQADLGRLAGQHGRRGARRRNLHFRQPRRSPGSRPAGSAKNSPCRRW